LFLNHQESLGFYSQLTRLFYCFDLSLTFGLLGFEASSAQLTMLGKNLSNALEKRSKFGKRHDFSLAEI
jgi:hypothetical protein